MNIRKQLVPTALAILGATTAVAGTAHFDIVTGTAVEGTDVSVTVQESNLSGYDYEFVIENNTHCDNDAGITGVYFESSWSSLFSSSPFDRNIRRDESPLNFVEGSASPNIGGWASSLVSYEIMGGVANGVANGVHTGHTTTVAFVANNGVTLDDIDAVLASQGFGLGIRLQDMFADDPQAAAWALAATGDGPEDHQCGFEEGELPGEGEEGGNEGGEEGEGQGEGPTGVPTPSAALMGLALLGIAGKRRRRD